MLFAADSGISGIGFCASGATGHSASHGSSGALPAAPASRADYGTTVLLVAPAKDEQYAVGQCCAELACLFLERL